MATYVIGDTHGCLLTLRNLVEEVIGISKNDKLFLLGDYIDRGPSSAQLVDYLIGIKEKGYNIFPLRGNHEQMIVDAIYNNFSYRQWMINSGDSTLKSYQQLLSKFFTFPNDLPDKHLRFFSKLPLYYEIDEKYILVHGALNFSADDPFSDTETMLWSRPESIPSEFLPGKKIIYGHTPAPLETIKASISDPNTRLIPLDAGCVYAGVRFGCGYLVALKLDDFTLYSAKNIDFQY